MIISEENRSWIDYRMTQHDDGNNLLTVYKKPWISGLRIGSGYFMSDDVDLKLV